MLIGYDPVKFHFEVSLFSPDDLKLHTKFRETSLFETSLYETSRHYLYHCKHAPERIVCLSNKANMTKKCGCRTRVDKTRVPDPYEKYGCRTQGESFLTKLYSLKLPGIISWFHRAITFTGRKF